ncbi:hypothetical protein D3C83_03780 [compost metagenome]
MFDWDRRQVDSFKATDVDGRHAIAFGVDAFRKRADAAVRTEAVPDDVLVERIGGSVPVGRQQPELVAGYEPQERALSLAHGTVARHRSLEIALHLVADLSAVAAALIFHGHLP